MMKYDLNNLSARSELIQHVCWAFGVLEDRAGPKGIIALKRLIKALVGMDSGEAHSLYVSAQERLGSAITLLTENAPKLTHFDDDWVAFVRKYAEALKIISDAHQTLVDYYRAQPTVSHEGVA